MKVILCVGPAEQEGRQGTRPRAVEDSRYISAYLFGDVCPRRGVGAGLAMPRANTESLNAHLAEIARGVAPGAMLSW